MFRYILSCPGVEKCVQESLVSAIKRSVSCRMLHKPVESLFAGAEHKNARIEAVGPSSVWSSRELGPVKEVITVPDHLSREEFKGVFFLFEIRAKYYEPLCQRLRRRIWSTAQGTSNGVW